MRATLHVWRHLTADGRVRCLKYSFGPGTANTLAVALPDGSWMVVSPATGAPASALDELARAGPVSALVAPNAYHHRGQLAWRVRFPGAASFAPEGAHTRLARQSPGITFRPLAELAERAGPRVALVIPQGLKAPDLLVRVSDGGTCVWWLGELFSNSGADDQAWWLRALVAPLAGSGLGYRRNRRPGLVYVGDQGAWLASVRAAVEVAPPTIVVPAHGDPVVEDTARRTSLVLTGTRAA